jgi:flagellar motor protein MotB
MKTFLALLITGLFVLLISNPIYSQDLLDKVKDKVKDRVDQKTDEAIDKGLDKVEEEATKDEEEKEGEEQQEENQTTKKADKKSKQETGEKSEQQEELKSYSKFDFVPGEKVTYYDDFSQDNVGDFPALWNTNGSGEVMTTNLYPGKWFKITNSDWYIPESVTELADNFTIQFDVIPQKDQPDETNWEFGFFIYAGNPKDPNEGGAIPGTAGIKMFFSRYQHSYSNYADGAYIIDGSKDIENLFVDKIAKFSIWGQKQRLRVYIGETKIFDLPKGLPGNNKFNQIRIVHSSGSPMFSNFRIAEAGADMRSKLLTEGKLVTHGILFDVNSDKIKPESYGTLKSIADILKENADVKVKIVGHTDSDGSDAANLDLSKRRAASVKASLEKDFGIDDSRMETDGKGESQPMADNKTSEGKANNRRVEFIKL